MVQEMCNVADCSFDIDNNIINKYTMNSELQQSKILIEKISIPFGLIAIIYESRPNVTSDAFAICFRSQNACFLKGGKESVHSNIIIVSIIKDVLKQYGLENVINLITSDREDVKTILKAKGLIDLCIPRGGKGLINFVRKNAEIPVIETGAGVVNLYFDEFGDVNIGKKIVLNSKTRRVSVCNALDCILIHKSQLNNLYDLVADLKKKNIIIYADKIFYKHLNNNNQNKYKFLEYATKKHDGMEFLDYKILIKCVNSIDKAIDYINKYGSFHSECIITSNENNAKYFTTNIDASTVYVNTSTAFTDGAQLGLNSEIGISTQKTHVRGPVSIEHLRTTKYVIKSNGSIRE